MPAFLTAIGTQALGSAVTAGNNALQGAQANLMGQVNNVISDVTNQVLSLGGLISGPTGAAGVSFYNDRNRGPQFWHGKTVKGKWRGFDLMFRSLGAGGLQSFGWKYGKTPRSAQAIFKRAENAFFEKIDDYLRLVATGQAQLDQSLMNADDYDIATRLAQFLGEAGQSTGSISTGNLPIEQVAPMPSGLSGNTQIGGMSVPTIALIGLAAFFILKR